MCSVRHNALLRDREGAPIVHMLSTPARIMLIAQTTCVFDADVSTPVYSLSSVWCRAGEVTKIRVIEKK